MEAIGEDIYHGTASIGVVGADIQLISAIAISLIIIVFSIVLWTAPPPEPTPTDPHPQKIPTILIVVGILIGLAILGLALLNWYFASSNTTYAAFSGVGDVVNLFK